MTEAEWMASADPQALLRWLSHTTGGGMGDGPPLWFSSDRKLRLFACAACRQAWDGVPCATCDGRGYCEVEKFSPEEADDDRLYVPTRKEDCPDCRGRCRVGGLTDPRSRRAVEVAERYADGLATEEELRGASRGAAAVLGAPGLSACSTAYAAARACWCASALRPDEVPGYSVAVSGTPEEAAAHAALLRCVHGNPWRPVELPGPPCPACGGDGRPSSGDDWERRNGDCDACGGDGTVDGPCPWLTPPVLAVARSVHDERRPADLPILADALEQAGCDDAGLLAHLRQKDAKCPACGGYGKIGRNPADKVVLDSLPLCPACHGTGCVPAPHALPGCHVVDLILGKD